MRYYTDDIVEIMQDLNCLGLPERFDAYIVFNKGDKIIISVTYDNCIFDSYGYGIDTRYIVLNKRPFKNKLKSLLGWK